MHFRFRVQLKGLNVFKGAVQGLSGFLMGARGRALNESRKLPVLQLEQW